MNKFLKFVGASLSAFALMAATVVALSGNNHAAATPQCEVTSVGERASAFTISDDKSTATVKFKATGADNCQVQVSVMSFYAPSMTGKPYDQQKLFDINTKTVGKGTHTLTGKLPVKSNDAKGCFYQVDLTYGTKIHSPVLAYGHGKLDCSVTPPVQKIKVCDLKTHEIVQIKESDFNPNRYSKNLADCNKVKVCDLTTKKIVRVYKDELQANPSRYTRDLSKCAPVPKPGEMVVCDLNSGDVITIKENEFDTAKYSKDVNDAKCTETEELPDSVASTGPEQAIASMFGLGGFAGSAVYYFQSRRNFLSSLFRR